MALQVDIELRDKVSEQLSEIEGKFSDLQARAEKVGYSISSTLKGDMNAVSGLAENISVQIEVLEKLKAKLIEVKNAKKALLDKGSAMTDDEHSQLLQLNKDYSNINKSIKEEEGALKELINAYGELRDKSTKSLKDTEKELKNVEKQAKDTGEETEGLGDKFKELGKLAAAAFTVDKAIEFGKKVIEVRGEMQALEASFGAMLGSKDAADKMLKDAIDFAATTPFDLQSVAAGAKQLLAYGTAQENVLNDMKMLGDVAAGLNIPLSQLIYLYGTLRAQGRVMTIDIRQFAMRGIPIYDELAKVLGVAKNEVSDFVSSGKVSFETVEQAFKNMTSEGGKFGGLMDGVFNTVNGKISNLGDNIYQMFNDIGKQTDGLIMAGLNVVSTIVDHYREIGKVIMSLVATYGVYKAAVMAVTAAEKAHAALVARNAVLEAAAAKGVNAQYMRKIALLRKVVTLQNALAKAHLTNPYVLATMAVAGLTAGIITAVKKSQQLCDSQYQYNQLIEETNRKEEEEKRILEDLQEAYYYDEKVVRIQELLKLYPGLLDKYHEEELYLMSIYELNKAIEQTKTDNILKEMQQLIFDIPRFREEAEKMQILSPQQSMVYTKKADEAEARLEALKQAYPALYSSLYEGPQPAPAGGTTVPDEVKNKKYWEKQKKDAEDALNIMTVEELNSKEGQQLVKQYQEAEKQLEKYSFKSKKTKQTISKDDKDFLSKQKEYANESKKLIESISDKIQKARESANPEDKDRMGLEYEVKGLKKDAEEIGKKMNEEFKGNVNLAERKVSTKEMTVKSKTGSVKILITPTLPDGTTLTDEQLQEYVSKTLSGANDILKADEKGLVVAVNVKDGAKTVLDTQMAQYKNILNLIDQYQKLAFAELDRKRAEEFEKMLNDYNVYQVQLKGVNDEYYNAQLKLINGMTEENADLVMAALDNLNKVFREQNANIAAGVDIEKFSDPEWMKSIENETVDNLYVMLNGLQNLFDVTSELGVLSEEEAIKLQGQIAVITKKIESGTQSNSEYKTSWVKTYEIMNMVGESIEKMGDGIERPMGEFLQFTGSLVVGFGKVTASIKGLKDSFSGLEKVGSFKDLFKQMKGKDVSAMLGGVITMLTSVAEIISKINNLINKQREAIQKVIDATLEYNRALESLAREDQYKAFSNAFGTDSYGEFLARYQESLNRLEDIKNKWTQTISAFSGSFKDVYKYLFEDLNGELVSDNRTNWQKFFNTGEDAIVRTKWSEFFDEEGNLLGDKLKEWYDTYGEGVNAGTRKMIEDLLAGWEDYTESVEKMNQYIGSLVGSVVDDIANDMYDAFLSVGNCILDMNDYMKAFQKNLAVSIIKSAFLSKIFNEDNVGAITELLGTGDTQGAVDLFNSLISQSEQMAPEIQKFLESLNLNLSNAQDSATAGGFQTMSQDLGNELNGRFTALQISNEAIRSYTQQMTLELAGFNARANNQFIAIEDIRQIQANALLELIEINNNTRNVVKPIKDMSSNVTKIYEKVNRL